MIDLTKLENVTGEITQSDIDHGVRCDHEHCALARAVERMVPGCSVFVDDYVAISNKNEDTELGMTDQILRWIDEFDNGKPVKPIPLVIYKSTTGVAPWVLCMGEDDEREPF